MAKKSARSKPGAGVSKTPFVNPDDAPEIDDDFLDRAQIKIDGKIVQRGRPPLGERAKRAITLRLDPDVIDTYRALGAGWRTQINDDLRKVRKLKKA